MWGMSRTLVQNIVTGVTDGFEKRLEITGVGYRAQVQGKSLNLAPRLQPRRELRDPEGIQVATPKPTEVVVTRHRQAEGRPGAAEIRRYRRPSRIRARA
jgi:large subunit ribosomal protein L6